MNTQISNNDGAQNGASLPPRNGSPKPVRLDERLLHRIGVREWGMPSICMPGKIWRSEKHGTITCMTPHEDASKVKIETLPLEVIPAGESMSEMPDHWRAALWEYVQAWPDSGHGLGPLLQITEEQRCDFIRNWAKELAASDNIGCCSIANAIGEFAAYGYELSENHCDDCDPSFTSCWNDESKCRKRPMSNTRHTWNIHYANANGESFHHQTIFEDEVRQIAAKALECGMISLTVLRTLNPVLHIKTITAPK